MKRHTYIFVALVILSVMSLPLTVTDRLRSFAAASFSLAWRLIPTNHSELKDEIAQLKIENYNYRNQIELLKAQIDLEKLISHQAELFKQLPQDDDYSQRRKAEIFRQLELYSHALIGKVIFRESASWTSAFWINIGEATNRHLGKTVVGKNSPVVVGATVAGVIEYVGENRSRVRLITDGSVVPSVRALRKNHYFAKGELQGAKQPLWRFRKPLLQGVGFNYNFNDQEGPALDLRTDAVVQQGDLLVTTGMDGVFPAGLMVAQVVKVDPLLEGAVSYTLEAEPLIDNFDTLFFVTVLPPTEQSDFID